MSHLVPTPRTDRNGRTVTRHMRDPSTPNAALKKLPPVALAEPSSHEHLLLEAVDTVVGRVPQFQRNSGKIRERLASYAPQTLCDMKLLSEDINMASAVYSGLMVDWTETTVIDYLHLEDIFRVNSMYPEMDYYLKSFPHYEELCPLPVNGPYPSERRDQCKAILELLHHMEDTWDHDVWMDLDYEEKIFGHTAIPYIMDWQLRKLILTSSRRQQAVQIIKERKLLDAEQIRELMKISLDADSPALMSGSL